MRRQVHLIIGSLAFLAYTYPFHLLLAIPSDRILLCFCAALFGSVMPDVLEPGIHRAHRGIGHSRGALKLSGVAFAVTAFLGFFQMLIPDLILSYVLSGFFLGYAAHLLADSTTPAGLPG